MTTFCDRLLLIFLVILCASGFFLVRDLFPSGTHVRVSLDNRYVYNLSLSEDRVAVVKGPLGDSLIEIKDHKVHMKDSPCKKKICMRQGWKDRGAIVCLPNRVVISVGGEQSEYDAISK